MSLLELLLPPACAGCGRPRGLLCDACLADFAPPSDDTDRFAAADAGVVIGDALLVGLAAFRYATTVRRALAALKFGGAHRLAPILVAAAVPALHRLCAISGPAVLVPVPVHRDRRRARGYNQAELLARGLASRTGMPTVDILRRTLPTTRQHRLNRAARLRNLRGAFAVADGAQVPPVAIVVDDIITTTATLEACAATLSAAGCGAVYGFAIAREV